MPQQAEVTAGLTTAYYSMVEATATLLLGREEGKVVDCPLCTWVSQARTTQLTADS